MNVGNEVHENALVLEKYEAIFLKEDAKVPGQMPKVSFANGPKGAESNLDDELYFSNLHDRSDSNLFVNERGKKRKHVTEMPVHSKIPYFLIQGNKTQNSYHGDKQEIEKKVSCLQLECPKQPNFNYKGESVGIYCSEHKISCMIDVVNRATCEQPGCTMVPTHNYPGEVDRRFCRMHRLPEMTYLRRKYSRTCAVQDCLVMPSYNYVGEKKRLFCTKHKMTGMVIIGRRICEGETCEKYAYFNFPGNKYGRACSEHKVAGMIWAVNHRECEEPTCSNAPCYKWEHEYKQRYCRGHKLEGMVHSIDDINKICQHPGCSAIGLFHKPGGKKGFVFCTEHRSSTMVYNKTNKICAFEGCLTKPSYNFPEVKGGIFCTKHKLGGMINKCLKVCEHLGCAKYAQYNFPGSSKSKFCLEHRMAEMINVTIFRKCEESGCNQTAMFKSEKDKRRRFCMNHRLEGMIVQKTRGVCQYGNKGCFARSCYNHPWKKRGAYCAIHKKANMVLIAAKNNCEHFYCTEPAIFNWEGETETKFCQKHKLLGMISLVSIPSIQPESEKKCTQQTEIILDSQSRDEISNPVKAHSEPHLKLNDKIVSKVFKRKCHERVGRAKPQMLCSNPNCENDARFSIRKEASGFCEVHLQENVVPSAKRNPRFCLRKGCSTRPTFGFPQVRSARLLCGLHKLTGMVPVSPHSFRSCCREGCNKTANYNVEGEKKPLYCNEHKKEGMLNVWRKSCAYPGCRKASQYAYIGSYRSEKPAFCAEHKLSGMVNITKKMCAHIGCCKVPFFNYEKKLPKYCEDHRCKGMVKLVRKRKIPENEPLEESGMLSFHTAPCLSIENLERPGICNRQQPQKEYMKVKGQRSEPKLGIQKKMSESIKRYEELLDIEERTCDFQKMPSYSLPRKGEGEVQVHTQRRFMEEKGIGQLPKEQGVPNVVHKCFQLECQEHALFNFEGAMKGVYCQIHKLKGMVFILKDKELETEGYGL